MKIECLLLETNNYAEMYFPVCLKCRELFLADPTFKQQVDHFVRDRTDHLIIAHGIAHRDVFINWTLLCPISGPKLFVHSLS